MDSPPVPQLHAGRVAAPAPWRAALGAAALIVLSNAAANTDVLSALNAVRASGCPGRPGAAIPLRANARLEEAARRSATLTFPDALAASGYRATRSLLIRIAGDSNAASVASLVRTDYCDHVTEAAYTEAGIHRQGSETRIVLAAPFSPPSADAFPQVALRVLELVNQARSQPRTCGTTRFPAAPPLRLDDTLNRVALAHATDMAQHSFLSHEGRDGSTPSDRVTRGGYRWRSVGENIASGATSAQAVVTGWMNSAQHCANLMMGRYSEMGVAYAVNTQSAAGIYWVLLAARR